MKTKKGKLLFCMMIILFIYLFCTYPREYNNTYSGIKYRLGTLDYKEHIDVSLKGYKYNSIFGHDRFKGSILIGKKEYSKMNLKFSEEGREVLFGFVTEIGEYRMQGEIFKDRKFDSLCICVGEDGEWKSSCGLMIAAPATTREEAINISNILMKDRLTKFNGTWNGLE